MKYGSQRYLHSCVHAPSFTVAKIRKQPKCLQTNDRYLRHCDLNIPGFFKIIKHVLLLCVMRLLSTSFLISETFLSILTSPSFSYSFLRSKLKCYFLRNAFLYPQVKINCSVMYASDEWMNVSPKQRSTVLSWIIQIYSYWSKKFFSPTISDVYFSIIACICMHTHKKPWKYIYQNVNSSHLRRVGLGKSKF